MNTTDILAKVGKAFYSSMFQLRKHGPKLMVIGGVAGVVASTVMACKATTKVSDILEEAKETADIVRTAKEYAEENDEVTPDMTGLTKEGRRALTKLYANTGLKLVKLYWPAVGLGALSIASILTSHHMMEKRNIGLAAAYAAIDGGFKQYRANVVERFGAEIDKELRYNVHETTVEETVVDENGKKKKVKKTVYEANLAGHSGYARVFDESNPSWGSADRYNETFLKAQQAIANDQLVANGYLFLNDVYDMLTIPKTKAGQVVGWVYDKNKPEGDNYVDFGLYMPNQNWDSVILDFNVDGYILDDAVRKNIMTDQ